jgi:hypothetical protein
MSGARSTRRSTRATWKADLAALLKVHGAGDLARALGSARSTVRRWRAGSVPAPAAQRRLAELVKALEGHAVAARRALPATSGAPLDPEQLFELGRLGFGSVNECLMFLDVPRNEWPSDREPFRRQLLKGRTRGKHELLVRMDQALRDRNAPLAAILAQALRSSYGWKAPEPVLDPVPVTGGDPDRLRDNIRAAVEKLRRNMVAQGAVECSECGALKTGAA